MVQAARSPSLRVTFFRKELIRNDEIIPAHAKKNTYMQTASIWKQPSLPEPESGLSQGFTF